MTIFLDLSKAFDTLDHDILLIKLSYYVINGLENTILHSYLTGRKLYVEFDGISSDMLPITTEVPQGSILDPLLFFIYLNDITNASTVFELLMYADDSTLTSTLGYFSIHGNFHDINIGLDKINKWSKVNKLSLNIGKSKYVIPFSTKKSQDYLYLLT